ncbi:ESPR-type extended signal peptide-containing protein [uncultured Dialister sp.]|uniref:ESPR-type extended signal peptide-containing protein n=1 Tax=uncultured Dialister sp. TaxID=278064 RepID=UPI00265C9797|nr:ESPR-type extended signal peptide-containing protein [uncultured Dialister sp.]
MNRVYKVIWSKAKHCYVVTSEIARGVTKSASSARSAGRKGAAVLAMAALLFTAGGVLGEAANVTKIAVNEPGNVITATKDDGNTDTITINNVDNAAHAKEADYATAATTAYSDRNGLTFEKNYAKIADVEKDYVKKTDAQVTNLTASGNVSAGSFTNGAATMSNGSLNGINQINATGNIVTTSNMKAHDITAEVTIKGETINAATGTFSGAVSAGSLNVTNKLEAGSIEAKGNLKGDSLTVTNNASVGGQLTAGTLAAAGNNFTVGADGNVVAAGVNAGAGTIKTTGAVDTGTLKTGGKAEIGGDLTAGDTTVKSLKATGDIKADGDITGKDITGANVTVNNKLTTKDMEVKGEFKVSGEFKTDHITLGSKPDNYTEINTGNVTSEVNDAVSGVKYTAESIFNKDGSSITARTDEGIVDSTGKSIVGAKEISQYLGNNAEPKSSDKKVTRNMVRNDDGTFSMEDKAVDGTKSSTVSQNAGERKVTAIDGNNKASTNLSNNGFNTYASDGKNKTYTKQTATDIKNTAEKGMISHTAKNLVNTASENMTNTVGKNLTTTVGGDSSLTAENITNEAKNKITNKALDVETDAASSIVSKVSNDYGSNTSTQLSHQTMEEMKAEGKTASYLRGAAEEKSQLTDGAKKTTIDTVAGQTNTNITEGKKVSNSLQKADQIASSVTDGTNTTVVNQNAGSLASSITDGTKANNTSSTVDKSEQLIKVDNTHFYAETKTAGSAVEALKSDGNTIISAKDAVTGTVSSAVTDGTNTTGSTMTAKGITNSAAESIVNEIGDGSKVKSEMTAKGITNTAKDGTITNDAKDLVNTASNSITDKVGENVERTMGTKKIEESVKDGTKSNTFTKTYDRDINVVTDGTNTSRESQLADRVNTSLKEVDGDKTTKSLNNVKTVSEDTTKITDTTSGAFSSSSQKADSITSTVKDTEKGTISERSQTVSQVQDKVGTTTVTTTDGLTKLINKEGTHKTVMDYANVTKDLNVNGDATVDQKLTVKGDSDLQGNATVGKNLEVKGTSTLTGDVTMESNATVTKDLTVKGASEFVHRADFRDDVYMWKDLEVTGETRTDTLYVYNDGYVDGNLYVAGNIETHDAELSENSRQVVTGRQLYQTNERVDKLDNRIKKVGANAAALAALRPGDFNPDDKFSIAAGFGSYRNANAAALGLFYRPNENVLLSLGTSFGDGENMVNAGVSVKFGRGKSMAERRKEMADEVSSMRDEMRSQDERIAELEEMLKKQSELIEKLSKES